MMKKNKTIMTLLIALAALVIVTNQTRADIVDLTTANSSGTINNALFVWTDFASTGTGLIDPFIRIQANGTQQGFNSDAGKFFDVKDSHSITISEIPLVNLNGINYREFLLDINQGNPTLLSLDNLAIYLSNSGSETSLAGLNLIWEMDAVTDSYILMDYSLNAGSGKGDMFAYIPDSAFGSDETKYVYLYSFFGLTNPSNAGFEEWAVRLGNDVPPPPPPPVPAPGAFILGMLGLCIAGKKLRKYA